jgi:hypothetical protein
MLPVKLKMLPVKLKMLRVPAIFPRDDNVNVNVNNCDVAYSCRHSTNDNCDDRARGLDEYPEPFSIRDVRVGLGEIDRVFLAAAPRQPKQP